MLMLAGRVKLPKEERERQEALRARFKPGMVLEFIKADYHEEDATPKGCHSVGDHVTLVRVAHTAPIMGSRDSKEVGRYDVWCVTGRWGDEERDAFYLAWMTKEAGTDIQRENKCENKSMSLDLRIMRYLGGGQWVSSLEIVERMKEEGVWFAWGRVHPALRRLADVFILERREEPGGLERGFRSRVLYRLMPKEVRS
jgi:hypothetical protein